MHLIPRTTLAQKMDALSSQSNIAGYKAVLSGACHIGKYMPLLMTAAGTIPPAKVVVLGAVHLLEHLDGEILHGETLHARLAPLLTEAGLVEHACASVLAHLELRDARPLQDGRKGESEKEGREKKRRQCQEAKAGVPGPGLP